MSSREGGVYNYNMENVKAKEQIKSLAALRGITMSQLTELVSKKIEKNYSLSSLSQKLNRGSIPYNEVMMIADILGFKVSYERAGESEF